MASVLRKFIPPTLKRERNDELGNTSQKRQKRASDNASSDTFASNPYHQMHIQSLPIIENLSIQILSTLAQGQQTIRIIKQPDSELGQAYSTLRSLFDASKKIYSTDEAFLSADDLNMKLPAQRTTIRITNLATFLSSIFGGGSVGFYALNDNFIDAFTSEDEPLHKEQGDLYLSLKTQIFMSATAQPLKTNKGLQEYVSPSGTSTKQELLEYLFPHDIDELLRGRHPEHPPTSSEVDFVKTSCARRDDLLNAAGDASIESVSWEEFLLSLSAHLSLEYKSLIVPHTTQNADLSASRKTVDSSSDNVNRQSEEATQTALRNLGFGNSSASPSAQYSRVQEAQSQDYYSVSSFEHSTDSSTRDQAVPTHELYQKLKAKQAAMSKTLTDGPRTTTLPSQRRPWREEEEKCLMAGLDAVKGPHWSQILELHGENGTVSRTLKGRTQVQLKDKARNLKLFFLKGDIEVPHYLQSVTGELKTRAPTKAAKKDAETREQASTEDQAKYNSIMALVGMQNGESLPESHSVNSCASAPIASCTKSAAQA